MDLLYLSRADVEGLGLSMREVLDGRRRRLRRQGPRADRDAAQAGHPHAPGLLHPRHARLRPGARGGGPQVGERLPAEPGQGPAVHHRPARPQRPGDGRAAGGDGLRLDHRHAHRRERRHLGEVPGARRTARSAAIVGCGVQARPSLAALVETLPALADVRCYDLLPAAAAAFIAEMGAAFPALRFARLRQRRRGRRAGRRRRHGHPHRHGADARARRRRSQGGRSRRLARLRLGVDERGHARLRQVLRRRRAAAAGHARARRVLRRHPGRDPRRPRRARRRAQAGPRARRGAHLLHEHGHRRGRHGHGEGALRPRAASAARGRGCRSEPLRKRRRGRVYCHRDPARKEASGRAATDRRAPERRGAGGVARLPARAELSLPRARRRAHRRARPAAALLRGAAAARGRAASGACA